MNSREQEMHLMQKKILRDQLNNNEWAVIDLKEIEKTIGINLDIIDETLRDTNFYLERIAIAIEKIAIHIRKEE